MFNDSLNNFEKKTASISTNPQNHHDLFKRITLFTTFHPFLSVSQVILSHLDVSKLGSCFEEKMEKKR